jgi:hypothetical protein
VPVSVSYHFRTRFSVSPKKAYEWCTDYTNGPEDQVLMGEENAERQVIRVADSTMLLVDTFYTDKGVVEKQKLVELYPDNLSWNATHLTGPAKYSQFVYEISADGENASCLDFTGLFLDYAHEKLNTAETKVLAEKLCKEDAEGWRLLAKAMAKDLGK